MNKEIEELKSALQSREDGRIKIEIAKLKKEFQVEKDELVKQVRDNVPQSR